MASRTLPGIALVGDWTLGEDGWKTGMDANLLRLSVLVQTAVMSSVAAYPGSPAQGDIHRLTGTADVGKIIVRDQGSWVLINPFEGMTIWDIAAQSRLAYTTADGWTSAETINPADVKTAYEANANTNAFTDAEQSKLSGIEAGATADQSASEIKTAYESNVDTNAFTDAEKTKLAGLSDPLFKGVHLSSVALTTAHPSPEAGSYAYVDGGVGSNSEMYIWDDDDGAWLLGGSSGGSSETPSTIKTKYESNADTNAYTDAEKAKLAGVAAGATVNDTDAALRDRSSHTGTQPAASVTGLAAVATSGSAADLGAGTLPSARFNDASHGNRAGGALHANATPSVSGFMSAADKTKLDALAAVPVNTRTSNYTLALVDAGGYVRMNMAGANTVTVPTNSAVAFDVGTVIHLRNVGAGQTTVTPFDGTVTINTSETFKLRKQGSSASLIKVGTNEWDLTGDLEAL